MSVFDQFQPSKLGTKQHWDEVYAEELSNFEDIGDEGEVWFGEESVEKMVDWCLANAPPQSSTDPQKVTKILEVGSGNGILLISLAEAGYPASDLHGIDYSPDAVELAQKVARGRDNELGKDTFKSIRYFVCDFLVENSSLGHYDLVLDKGTFDAMALSQKQEDGTSPAAVYPGKVSECLNEGGLFLITSCNFTEDELTQHFTKPDCGMLYHSRIQHKTYTLGGKTGSVCSSVAFVKPPPASPS